MKSLLLELDNWDLCVDAAGNIAVADEPYRIAQDVASAIKTFAGEVWYDSTLGIPYFSQILGQHPPLSLFQEYMVNAALSVDGVAANPPPQCIVTEFDTGTRTLTGSVTFTDTSGNQQVVAL